MKRTILASDIGGTNARFGVFIADDAGGLALQIAASIASGSTTSFTDLLRTILDKDFHLTLSDFDAGVIAVAGPVQRGISARLPNVSWPIELTSLRELWNEAPLDRFRLINDFAAQVLACRTAAVRDAVIIQDGEPEDDGLIAAIGAGTGLGCCAMTRGCDGRDVVIPSEASHQEFAFLGGEERRFADFVQAETGVIAPTYDALICGRGLALLHQFFNAERRSPAEVAEQLTSESEVARLFSRFYARAARNYALAVLPLGGIYISGGVAAKNPFLVDNDIFRREFTASKQHQSLLQRVPIRLNRNEESGVWGAAHHAMQLLHPSKA